MCSFLVSPINFGVTSICLHTVMLLTVLNEAIAVLIMKAYLSFAEIANVTKKEKTNVLRWIKVGRFGYIRKVGNEYGVPHESFKNWWERRLLKGIDTNQQWQISEIPRYLAASRTSSMALVSSPSTSHRWRHPGFERCRANFLKQSYPHPVTRQHPTNSCCVPGR